MNQIQVDSKEIKFTTLDSGDVDLDAVYFIKLMFDQYNITPESQIKILNYLKTEAKDRLDNIYGKR